MQTVAPCWANITEIAFPMPLPPPVTMATLLSNLSMNECLTFEEGDGLIHVQPPSTIIFCPVICFALSETRKRAVFAMSATEAGLPIGVIRDQVCSYSGSSILRLVKVAPGA